MEPLGQRQPGDSVDELNIKLLKLETRLQRERLARLEAEAIAEKGLRELYEKQRQLELLETVATRANESRSVDETLQFATVAICAHTGWMLGNVYVVDEDDRNLLRPTGIWYADDPDLVADFVDASAGTLFRSGDGLPGRVLASGKSAWIMDVTTDDNFRRSAAAKRCGLSAAFAFPVLVGSEVLAVMEFFHQDQLELDESLLTVMSQVGTQLGRVMERRRAEDKLIHDATHDALTGLPNRVLFTDRLEHALLTRRRQPKLFFAVLFIDLDRFKLVNDSFGHSAGDQLLIEIAARLSASLAAIATEVGAVATLARIGGDEFTVLIEQIAHESDAVRVAEQLQEALAPPILIEGQELYTSASIGVALCENDAAGAADILRDSDLAMYRAKAEGRARIEVFDSSLLANARTRLTLESDLRRALARNEFVLHYQPIVSLDGDKLVGFEALVRWRRPDAVLVYPADFIGIAEETGLIVFLGQWVMCEAFAALARWQRATPREKPLTMSVNVSPKQFQQPDFVDQVIAAVTQSGVAPATIRLEITENVTIQDAERALAILQRLREFGVRMSIDDFGTGYSSLAYLHQLPFDTLKIDRSFVRALQQPGTEGRDIIQTILDMARNLHMDVVAEGAETALHVEQLRLMGCEYAQGFFFSRPLEESAATRLLSGATPVAPPA